MKDQNKRAIWVDPKTGLEWQVEPAPNAMTWKRAKEYAASLGEGWRLPSEAELVEISGKYRPDELRGRGRYWSSSPVEDGGRYAWNVTFYDGYVGIGAVGIGGRVRCVRGELK